MRNNAHIQEQEFILRFLRSRDYKAEFGLGLEHCKELIKNYLEENDK
jgi:hypothetical protein